MTNRALHNTYGADGAQRNRATVLARLASLLAWETCLILHPPVFLSVNGSTEIH